MAEPEENESEETPKRSKKPLLIGVVLALLLGGGGFYAVWSGMILAPEMGTDTVMEMAEPVGPIPDVTFVPIQPIVVNIGPQGSTRHLRFQAQLEVNRDAADEVTLLLPRVTDVLNGYLRAVDLVELEQRTALIRLRAQMLRRVQVVTGEGRVRDLLIMEFVIN